MTGSPPLRVAIVNDYDIVLRGMATLLSDAGMDAVLVPDDALVDADVILYDTHGSPEGWGRVETLLASGPPVVVFSWSRPSAHYRDLIERGLAGFISKSAGADEVVSALQTLAAGGTMHPDPMDVEQVVGAWPGQEHGLTARESEIIALMLHGLSNDQIADRVFLSVNTVKSHVRTAYRKARVATRSQAIVWALTHGFVAGGGSD